MKKKFILAIFFILIIVIMIVFIARSNSKISMVDDIGKKNLFIEKNKIQSNQVKSQIVDDTDFAWNNIEAGKDYYTNGQYEQAVEAFKKAYSTKYGSKAVAGLNLARCYEKLGLYNEGIALVNQMIENGELSGKGIQNANEIKLRLMAAKDPDSVPTAPK